jgi:hypothetical protein
VEAHRILVNNAGTTWGAAAEDHPLGVEQGDQLNLNAVFAPPGRGQQARFRPHHRHVASVAGLRGFPAVHGDGGLINFTR